MPGRLGGQLISHQIAPANRHTQELSSHDEPSWPSQGHNVISYSATCLLKVEALYSAVSSFYGLKYMHENSLALDGSDLNGWSQY